MVSIYMTKDTLHYASLNMKYFSLIIYTALQHMTESKIYLRDKSHQTEGSAKLAVFILKTKSTFSTNALCCIDGRLSFAFNLDCMSRDDT